MITCPAGKEFSFYGATEVRISISDLGIESDSPVFFTNAFITDVNDHTGSSVEMSLRPGSITNTGTEIIYTVDSNNKTGDRITIEYLATDQSGERNADCEQTFYINLDPAEQANKGNWCKDRVISFTSAELPYRLNISELYSEELAELPVVFQHVIMFDSSTSDEVGFFTVTDDEIIFDSLSPGLYEVFFELEDANQSISSQCSVSVNYSHATGAAEASACIQQADVFLSNGSNNSVPMENVATGQIVNLVATDLATGEVLDDYPVVINGSGLIIFDVPNYSSVHLTYDVLDRSIGEIIASCPGFKIIKSPDVQGGANNLDCNEVKWRDGTPSITCGDPKSTHVAYLQKTDGTPLTVSLENLNVGFENMPDGFVITAIDTDGLGSYTFEIDASEADCVSSSIGNLLV